ncbi:MAG: LytTR family DNA-binding domain-containing protein [Sulfurimonadaceae bacterium]|nr:LytTR family DNA-binding domain-containing protein [Sulfurimonadaceae bacterium]
MNILIVEDEALARQRLERMLKTLGYDSITHAENAEKALSCIDKEEFDIAFLDINMPGISGLELGYEMRYHQSDIGIVFQTAHTEHALEAFDIGAVGYLVKPYSIEQLKSTIERIQSSSRQDEKARILSKNGEHYYLLKPDDIYYIKADLSEVMIRTQKGFSYYSKKISELESMLQPFGFVRIHRSILVNTEKIKEMETIEQSKLRFSFEGINDQVESSKDGAKMFRNLFSN